MTDETIAVAGDPARERRPRVLALYPTASYFGAILRVAATLRELGNVDVAIYSPARYPGFEDQVKQAEEAGIWLFTFMREDRKGHDRIGEVLARTAWTTEGRPRLRSTRNLLSDSTPGWTRRRLDLVSRLAPGCFANVHAGPFAYWNRSNGAMLDRADQIVDTLGIDLLVTFSESMNYNSQHFVASMRAAGKRSIFMPLSIPSINEMDGWMSSQEDVRVDDAAKRIFASLFPRWVRRMGRRRMLRAPLGRAMSDELLGLAPRLPWRSFTAGSDVVATTCEFQRSRLIEMGAGYRRDSMLVVGSPDNAPRGVAAADRTTVRQELRAACGSSDDRSILLFSPTSDMTRQYSLPEFESYLELLDYWLRSFRSLRSFDVVVTPHPYFRINAAAREVLEGAGLPVVWRSASDLIPGADVFATFGASSTPRLAAAAGLPVLNYLCFDARFGRGDEKSYFVGFDSIPVARNRREWEALLATLDDPAEYRRLAERARRNAPFFGALDGSFADRLRTLVEELAPARGGLTPSELHALARKLNTA